MVAKKMFPMGKLDPNSERASRATNPNRDKTAAFPGKGGHSGPGSRQTGPAMKRLGRKDKMKPIRNDKDAARYVGGKINDGINEGGRKIKDGANRFIKGGSERLIKGGADKNLVNYAGQKIGKGINDMVNQGAGAAKKWIHTEGKQALQKGAAHVGSKIKEGWGKLKSKFQK